MTFQSTQPKRAATRKTGYLLPPSLFQSTQPKRAATLQHEYKRLDVLFQSTQPKRAATSTGLIGYPSFSNISIHAAQEGCDLVAAQRIASQHYISIHAAQEGCDKQSVSKLTSGLEFQSTQPKRAATASWVSRWK